MLALIYYKQKLLALLGWGVGTSLIGVIGLLAMALQAGYGQVLWYVYRTTRTLVYTTITSFTQIEKSVPLVVGGCVVLGIYKTTSPADTYFLLADLRVTGVLLMASALSAYLLAKPEKCHKNGDS